MAKQKFNALALEQLLTNCTEQTEQLTQQISEYDYENSPIAAPTSPNTANLINNEEAGHTVDYNRVYSQLEKLIENGNIALEILGAVDPDVSGMQVASATASLMNAVKNCVAEFTKIHMQHIKFQQQIQMMELKHHYKMLELEKRKEMYAVKSGDNIPTINSNANGQVTEMVEWETENMFSYFEWQQQNEK